MSQLNTQWQPQQQQQRQPQQQRPSQQQQYQQNGEFSGQNTSVYNRRGINDTGNYNEHFLSRLREFRKANIVLFNLEETEEEGINDIAQKHIDMHETRVILRYIDDEELDLENKVVEVTRLGRKSEGKIRPIRIRFENEYYREAAVMNSYKIKYHEGGLSKVKVCRDLIRDDREKAKVEYERKKQLKLAAANNGNSPIARDLAQATPINESIASQADTGREQAPPHQEEQANLT